MTLLANFKSVFLNFNKKRTNFIVIHDFFIEKSAKIIVNIIIVKLKFKI